MRSGELVLQRWTSVDGRGPLPDYLVEEQRNVDPLAFDPDPVSVEEHPMIADPFARCDLDLDGDCDIYDYEIVSGVLGECIGGGRFIDLADADHDGCVTQPDVEDAFPIIPVAVDIKPGSCPNTLHVSPSIRSRKVIVVVLPGSEDFDPTTVVPESITLQGVSPFWWNIDDKGSPLSNDARDYCACHELESDGVPDLTLKFRVSDLERMLNENPPAPLPPGILPILGLTIPLTLHGQLTDGTPIEGKDCVFLRLLGDIDGDKKVDITDAIAMLMELFISQGGEVDPETLDVNGDGLVDLADVVWLLDQLF